jgi:hypothetical protein
MVIFIKQFYFAKAERPGLWRIKLASFHARSPWETETSHLRLPCDNSRCRYSLFQLVRAFAVAGMLAGIECCYC